MKGIVRLVKKLFGVYEIGYEYWVYTKDITVPTYLKMTPVGRQKWIHKLNYWRRTGRFESPIYINRDFVLVDGFSSMKIAYLNGIEKIPVYFAKTKEKQNERKQ